MSRLSARAVLVAIVVFTCGASYVNAQDVPRNTKPLTPFKVLLSSSFFNGTLPFDVPFILWGDVPDDTGPSALPTTSVTLRIAEIPDGASECREMTPNYGEEKRSEARTWTATDYADRGITAPADVGKTTRKQFEFRVQKLSPQRHYCFLFHKEPGRLMRAAELALVTPRLLPAYRRFLEGRGTIDTVGTTGVEALRQALIKEVLSGLELEGIKAAPGNIFDPDAEPSAVFNDFATAAVAVFNRHNQAFNNLQRANQPGPTDLAEFRDWVTGPAITALEMTLPAGGPAQVAIATVKGWSAEQRLKALLGVELNAAVIESLADVWQTEPGYVLPDLPPAEGFACPPATSPVSARCNRLEGTRQLLATIQAAAGGLTTPLGTAIAGTQQDVVGTKNALAQLQMSANLRQSAMQDHLGMLQLSIRTAIVVATTTLGDLATRKTWYAGMDTGFAIAPSLNEVFPYVGTLLYFRPINREAPPSSFLTRFSALVGITWTSNLVKAGQTAPLWGSNSMLLFGGGLRATEFIRVGAGALVLKSVDPNPFVVDRPIHVTPFFNLSIDIDIAGVFGRLFGSDFTPPVIGAGTTQK
jgi:hypothetical protein